MSSQETEEVQIAEESPSKAQEGDGRRFHAWSHTFWQFFRYCLVGGANTISDVLTFNALLWCFPTNNVQVLVLYNSVAYASGALTSFFLNKYWTFRHKQKTTRREVVRFMIILLLEILYSNGLLWLAGKTLQPWIDTKSHLLFLGLPVGYIVWGNTAKLIAVVGGTITSYLFMRFWIFAKPRR